jgi:hypothetical protein
MKRSLSSNHRTLIIFLFFLIFLSFFSLANCRIHSQTNPFSPSSRNTHNNNQHKPLHCDSFSKRKTFSLCTKLQRINQRLHKQVSPSHDYEIDPRFGVEKRLVPSGPNPLHNWFYYYSTMSTTNQKSTIFIHVKLQ